jgi:Flp pilus assembly protein CpaB
MQTVVVAVHDIPQNVHLTNEMVKIIEIESQYALPGSFAKLEEVLGAITTSPVYNCEQIVKERITTKENPSQFCYAIPEGKRAITVAVNEISGVSGLIRPGDRVDVLFTMEVPSEDAGSAEGQMTASDGKKTINVTAKVSWAEELQLYKKISDKLLEGKRIISFDGKNITFELFQNIDVLAIGSDTVKTAAGSGSKDEKSGGSITMSLDPLQADLLTNAEKAGSIKFDLRNPVDTKIEELKPVID